MNNKDNKEATPEKKYIPFHRERQEPIDCFTRHEVDNKIKVLRESFNKKLQEQKDEIEEYHKEDLEKLKAQFDNILKKISEKFEKYYTQEELNQFVRDIKSRYNSLDRIFDMLEKQHEKLEELVLEYLELTDIGKNVGGHFVLNEKKKRLWKK